MNTQQRKTQSFVGTGLGALVVLVVTFSLPLRLHAQTNDNCTSGAGGYCVSANNTTTPNAYGVTAETTAGTAVSGTDTSSGYGVSGSSSTGMGTVGTSSSGVGAAGFTASFFPSSGLGTVGLVGGSESTGIGVYGSTYGAVAPALIGSTGTGVEGVTNQGVGVAGFDDDNGTGVYASSYSGQGVVGLSGVFTAPAEIAGVVGSGSGSGVNGGYFASATADAVYANTAATSGGKSAIKGEVGSSNAFGVTGVNDAGGIGVVGLSDGATVGSGSFGVYGGSTNNNGVNGVYSGGSAESGVYGGATGNGDGNGVYGHAFGSGVGVFGVGTTGYGGEFTTVSGTYAAYFNKDIDVDGSIYGPSDIRWKKNVKAVRNPVEQILLLRGVTFDWIDPEKHGGHGETQIGFIAQEVEKVFPGWVHTDKDGFKTVGVGQLEGLEVEAIRALKTENDDLRAQIQADHARLEKLETDRATLIQLKDELDSLKAGRNPMTGDRGILWLIAMTFAVGGGVIVTRKQSERRS